MTVSGAARHSAGLGTDAETAADVADLGTDAATGTGSAGRHRFGEAHLVFCHHKALVSLGTGSWATDQTNTSRRTRS